jgi:hypothetical protein
MQRFFRICLSKTPLSICLELDVAFFRLLEPWEGGWDRRTAYNGIPLGWTSDGTPCFDTTG